MEWREVSNDQIDQSIAHFSGLAWAALAVVSDLLMEADRRQQWLADGAADLKQWTGLRMGVRHSTASRLVDLARRLQDLPQLKDSFETGEFSPDQLESLSRMATPDSESALIEEARGLSNAALDRAARRANPPSTDDAVASSESRSLHIQRTLDGRQGKLQATLPGESLDVVESAVRDRADRIPVNPETGVFDPYSMRMADGLVELCATSGDRGSFPPQITVHADLEALITEDSGVTETELGLLLANETARRLACDSVIECAVFEQSRLVGVGRKTRQIPGWLRRQLHFRDRGCRFPGCGRTSWTHGHHIQHWADGGTTDLGNLVVLCGYHHRFVHEHGWMIEADPGGAMVFRRPDGRSYPPVRPELSGRLKALVCT